MSNKFRGDISPGNIDVTIYVKLVDSTTGADKTGIASGSVTCYYWRQGASSVVQITISAGASLGAAHSDGKWFEVDSTNLPGIYRLDLTDATTATGADWVVIDVVATGCKHFQAAFNLDPIVVDSSGQVKLGTTATGAITTASFAAGAINASAIAADAITASTIADAAIDAATFAAGAITASAIAADAITASAIANGAFDNSAFAADAIDSNVLATTAVDKIADGTFTRTLGTESYAADGSVPTFAQMLFMLWAFAKGHAISGVTLTSYKLDDSSTAMTFTLAPNAATPTSITRTS